jgi:hypothetical protein
VDVWIDVPRPDDVAPIVEWLTHNHAGGGVRKGTDPSDDDAREDGWWLYCSRRRMESFAEAWETRPAGVDWYGSERARRLLPGPNG